jgi:hypothetical protein
MVLLLTTFPSRLFFFILCTVPDQEERGQFALLLCKKFLLVYRYLRLCRLEGLVFFLSEVLLVEMEASRRLMAHLVR